MECCTLTPSFTLRVNISTSPSLLAISYTKLRLAAALDSALESSAGSEPAPITSPFESHIPIASYKMFSSNTRTQANLYPQLPSGQQQGYYPNQPGAMQPYSPAGPSQPYQPPSQAVFQPQPQQFQTPSNQGYGFGQRGGMYSNPPQQSSVYQPMAPSASGSFQPGAQGPSQQVSQLQQGQGGNQAQQGYRPTVASTSPMPQTLETVSPTEDPIYGPLGRARNKVDRGLRADEEISPDLADMLSQQCKSKEQRR